MNIRQAWLWLTNIDGIGNKKISKLFGAFDSPMDIYNANEGDLRQVMGLAAKDITEIEKSKGKFDIKKYEEYMLENEIKYITIQDKNYPKLLKNIYDPPYILYYKGSLPNKNDVMVGVVGSRHCTEYGKKVAYNISKSLAEANVTIVSGMAIGTDTFAHKGALDGKGKTIAVLGCGVDICYPKSNKDLMKEIIKNGAVISEYPPKLEPIRQLFPARNRIISGLSKGVLVVEAAIKSGSLITVNQALEQGRDVFSIPGNITSELSGGTNQLIKQGAIAVTKHMDILLEIGVAEPKVVSAAKIIHQEEIENAKEIIEEENIFDKLLDEDEKIVYACINLKNSYIDDLASESKFDISKLQHVLTMLEIKGIIKQLPGKRFERLM
ncbi:MAG: DNA protecting protein DprA [Clostridiales bacterium GWE2_32_10]|nr:MAG: DNA protecting protein DprA [Clostridiales bacterium GWE2_32_10]HBY20701.1 DNA-protecting protein DprA [Clostridiales bacterium]